MTQTDDGAQIRERASQLVSRIDELHAELRRCVIGQDALIEDLLVALLAGGHVLIEGLPGLGKTLLVKSLAVGLGVEFGRIQFTPDLMPADVLGTRIVEEGADGLQFRFQRGPIFSNLLLADEINRTTPKTQSALLEAMQEGRVTIGETTHDLPRPFCVVATQNPIELEGTYPLPEAQLDRFLFKLVVEMPDADDLVKIFDSTTGADLPSPKPAIVGATEVRELQTLVRQVLCGKHLLRFTAEMIRMTQPEDYQATAETRRFVRFGASPRAGQAMILAAKARALLDARPSVSREDLEQSMLASLRHRVVLTFDAEAEGTSVASLLPSWIASAEQHAR